MKAELARALKGEVGGAIKTNAITVNAGQAIKLGGDLALMGN